ncbi:hypothetical protein [Roseibium algae]|uniref:Uncharacterized protein n=1 Tax=Roseibium algae TaxID=3123038 RepID=A0ABU8TJW7_9HYPH
MAAKSSMLIQFPRGGTIPAKVLGAKKDRVCEPGEPVKVPKTYATHLIERRIAVAAEEASRSGRKAVPEKKDEADPFTELKAAVIEAEKGLDAADTDEEKAAAQVLLDEATQALTDAVSGS